METATPSQVSHIPEKQQRKPAPEASIDPEDVPPGQMDPEDMEAAPTMIIIASASTQAAVDLMTKFNQMFGDEAIFTIATDGTIAGGWPLTLAYGEIGCHFRADFLDPILDQIALKMNGEVSGGHCCYGDGEAAYKVKPPSPREVDGMYF